MQKKQKIGVIIFIVLIIMALAILFYLNKEVIKFNRKMNLLKNLYEQNENIDEDLMLVSICDTENQAVVRNQEEAKKYVKENKYNSQWIKIDFIKEEKETTLKDFFEYIKTEDTNSLKKGIILCYENREVILMPAELISNDMIDYDENQLILKNINQYLESQDQETIPYISAKVKIFSTISYFCDEKNKVYEINNDNEFAGRRVVENNIETVNYVLNNSSEYLANMIQADGKFIYGYSALENEELDDYNIIRHAGSVWSLIETYNEKDDKNGELKNKITKAIEYMNENNIQVKDDETEYIQLDNELNLGGNACAILAMSAYTTEFNDNQYIETMEKLANGIISMQNEDGSYIHTLKIDDYSVSQEYRIVYYDGEATLALCKLYGITQNEKYLEAAKKAVQHFIDANYIQYSDHWVSYSMNEITKYVDDKEYYEFGLKNIAENIDTIYEKTFTSHTDFEMLMQGVLLYNRAIEKQIDIDYLQEFPIEKVKETIEYRMQMQLNSYMYPEISMYLKEPSKYTNAFYIRQDNFRIRIDDIQHSILGFVAYKNYIEE